MQFNSPADVSVSPLTGRFFVSDTSNNRIQVFSPDSINPEVISTEPTDGATGVSVGSSINSTFSEVMDSASVNNGTFTLTGLNGTNNTVDGNVIVSSDGKTANLNLHQNCLQNPIIPLQYPESETLLGMNCHLLFHGHFLRRHRIAVPSLSYQQTTPLLFGELTRLGFQAIQITLLQVTL